jgi:hypothetical protein
MPLEAIERAAQQLAGDELVESADDNGVFSIARCQLPANFLDHIR